MTIYNAGGGMTFYVKALFAGIVVMFALLAGLIACSQADAHWPYSTTRVAQDLYVTNFDGMCGKGDEGCDRQTIAAWGQDSNGDGAIRRGEHSYEFRGSWREVDYLRGWGGCDVAVRVNSHWDGRFNIGEVYWTLRTNTNIECEPHGDGF